MLQPQQQHDDHHSNEPAERIDLIDGLWMYKYCGGRIISMHHHTMSRESIDLFFDTAAAYFDHCLQNEWPVLYLYEVGKIGFTPYSRQRVESFVANYQHLAGYGAYVFARSPLTFMIKFFVMRENRQQWPRVSFESFETVAAGLAWLFDVYGTQISAG